MTDTPRPRICRAIILVGWAAVISATMIPAALAQEPPVAGPVFDPYSAAADYDGPLWRASADLVLLGRTNSGEQTLILQQVGGIELLNAQDMTFDGQLGPRVSLVREAGEWDLELVHFHVTGWSSTASEFGPPTIVYPGSDEPNDGFIKFANEMRFTAESSLYSTELNVGFEVWPMVRLLAGFRWIEFRDAVRGEAIDPGFPAYLFTDNNVNNQLYGGQLGLDLTVLESDLLRLSAVGKAGLFGNNANTTTAMSDGFFLESVDGGRTAFVGEILVVGDVQLSPTWSLRTGLQLLWLTGVGLAPEQLDQTHAVPPPNSQIDLSGNLFAYGLLVGLEARY